MYRTIPASAKRTRICNRGRFSRGKASQSVMRLRYDQTEATSSAACRVQRSSGATGRAPHVWLESDVFYCDMRGSFSLTAARNRGAIAHKYVRQFDVISAAMRRRSIVRIALGEKVYGVRFADPPLRSLSCWGFDLSTTSLSMINSIRRSLMTSVYSMLAGWLTDTAMFDVPVSKIVQCILVSKPSITIMQLIYWVECIRRQKHLFFSY